MTAQHSEIAETAALWILHSEEPGWTAVEQAELDAWLGESYLHRATYLRLRDGWRVADRAIALELRQSGPKRSETWRSWDPAILWRAAAAIAISVMAASVMLWFLQWGPEASRTAVIASNQAPEATSTLVTKVGEQATVPLNDGSQIEINTNSVVRVKLTSRLREVWLDRGEAYFEVAHSAEIPFLVHAGSHTVRVMGTRFDVRRDQDKLTVAVAEGHVNLENSEALKSSETMKLVTGDLAIMQGKSLLVAVGASDRVERLLAWRTGTLIFADTKLEDAVAEFNRYSERQIIIADAQTANIPIGGAFQASNVDAFLRLLHQAFDLNVTHEKGAIIISKP